MTLPSPQGGIPTKITKYSESREKVCTTKKAITKYFTSNSRKFLIAPRTISKGISPRGFNSTSTYFSELKQNPPNRGTTQKPTME